MKKIATILLLLSSAIATGALAAEIYKWTDADGNVHYGDRPTGDGVTVQTGVERVAIASSRTNSARVEAGVEARLERESARTEAATAAEESRKEAEAQRAEAEDRAEKCVAYRERLQKFLTSRRLYRVDDDGERDYLDDGQMDAARAQVQAQVEEYCSS